MKLAYLFIITILASDTLHAQTNSKLSVGIEQDILPYLTKGYYAGFWAGKSKVRVRALTAHVTKPDFITPDGFTNNQVTAYALLVDYFLKPEWNGWWAGTGMVYWDNSIQKNEAGSTTDYNNFLLNGSLGYQWKFYKHFYISPWAGMHIRIAGDKEVSVDGSSFNTPILNPEASLKVGWYF